MRVRADGTDAFEVTSTRVSAGEEVLAAGSSASGRFSGFVASVLSSMFLFSLSPRAVGIGAKTEAVQLYSLHCSRSERRRRECVPTATRAVFERRQRRIASRATL